MQPDRDLDRLLSAAGARARADRDAAPDRDFAVSLRERLLAQLPDRDAEPRVGWSLGQMFRLPRLIPLAAASLLLVAAAVAGRDLYVALGDHPTPTPVPSVSVEPEPSFTLAPVESVEVVASAPEATPEPTAVPTPVPTAKPTPKPTPVPPPPMGVLALETSSCPGGVVLGWSSYEGAGAFNHYLTLRNTSESIPKAYPPQGGVVDPGGTYASNIGKTSAVDADIPAGVTYYYRTMAFNADDGVIAASSITSAVAAPVGSLGSLSVSAITEGTKLAWTPFDGSEACFTWYKLVYSETNPSPSYLGGDSYLAALENPADSQFVADSASLLPGHTYYLRVQVIRATDLGGFLVAQTDVATYTVP